LNSQYDSKCDRTRTLNPTLTVTLALALALTLTLAQAERDTWTAAIMENAHQPSCRANLLASLLTYQLHQAPHRG